MTEHACTHPVRAGSVCPSHGPGHWQAPVLLRSVPACFKEPRHPPSTWTASESLECFPSLPGPLLTPGAFRSGRAISTLRLGWYTKTLQFPEESWDLGSPPNLPPPLPPPPPPQSAWGTALGNLSSSLLKGQGLTLTSVPPGQLCRGQEILLGFLGPWLQASGSGDTSVTATNICVAICKPCP